MSTTNKKVSILTVCFNSEAHISENLNSVSRQTYQSIEHIVIDGDSTDNTVEIIKRHASSNSNFIWKSEPDKGMYDALNKALDLASGNIIYCMNSDDQLADPLVIEKVVEKFKTESTSDLLIGDIDFLYSNKRRSKRRAISVSSQDIALFGNCTFVPQPAMFISKNLCDKVGEFDLNYKIASDYDFIIRALAISGKKTIPLGFTTSIFRRHENSLTETQSETMLKETNIISQKYRNDIKKTRARNIYNTVRYLLKNPQVLTRRFL